jgi:t-SNARE complex subunit (syntaxin)
MAIITTLLCCLPLGIVSIVYASQVNSKWSMGDYQGAMASAESARKWWIAALASGLVVLVLYVVLVVVLGVTTFSFNQSSY